jgi:hypothetical protein
MHLKEKQSPQKQKKLSLQNSQAKLNTQSLL